MTRKGKLRPRSGQHFDVPLICCYDYGHAVPAVVNADTLRLPFRLADFYDKVWTKTGAGLRMTCLPCLPCLSVLLPVCDVWLVC